MKSSYDDTIDIDQQTNTTVSSLSTNIHRALDQFPTNVIKHKKSIKSMREISRQEDYSTLIDILPSNQGGLAFKKSNSSPIGNLRRSNTRAPTTPSSNQSFAAGGNKPESLNPSRVDNLPSSYNTSENELPKKPESLSLKPSRVNSRQASLSSMPDGWAPERLRSRRVKSNRVISSHQASFSSLPDKLPSRHDVRENEPSLAFKRYSKSVSNFHSTKFKRATIDSSDISASHRDQIGLSLSLHNYDWPDIEEDSAIDNLDYIPDTVDIENQKNTNPLLNQTHQQEPERQRLTNETDGGDASSLASKDSITGIGSLKSSFTGGQIKKIVSFDNLRKRYAYKKENTSPNNKEPSTTFAAPSYRFLAKDESKAKVSIQAGHLWWRGVFVISTLMAIACIITLWAPYPVGLRMPSDQVAQTPWSDGCKGIDSCVCPRATICADDLLSMIFLTLARTSAWFDYPLYMLLFLSKARNFNNFLQGTMLKCWINFSDAHRVHSLFGIIVGIESTSHSFFHLLRWARRKDDIQLLWTSQTGITGLIVLLLGALIVLPMTVPFLKSKISFEWRKGLHYLSIVWGACLMYHAPQRIFWMIGVPLVVYAADHLFGIMHKTHLVENAFFERLGDSSCVITFENPASFGKANSAYCFVMLPWISKYQFHAFSVYPSSVPNCSQFCISKSGDWTAALMNELAAPAHKAAFIVGPFLSPFSSPAMDCEHIIAVASGIGVTPILGILQKYAYTQRRISLVWMCRDPGLIEHFLNRAEMDFAVNGYTLIYYTGKRRLLVIEKELPSNILIYSGRPDLERTLTGIVSSVNSGVDLDSTMKSVGDGVESIRETPVELRAKVLLEKALSIYSTDQLFQYALDDSDELDLETNEMMLEDAVGYQRVVLLMQQLLKEDCRFIMSKLSKEFEQFNSEQSHLLNRKEFDEFMHIMCEPEEDETNDRSSARRDIMFQPKMNSCDILDSTRFSRQQSIEESQTKKLFRTNGKNWSMLYCGGSKPVLDDLKKYKHKFGIKLAVEKFDW